VHAVRFQIVLSLVSVLAVHAASSVATPYTITDVGPGVGFGINDSGQVTGRSSNAFVWTPTTPGGVTGAMTDLGTLGGTSSSGIGINASGQVLGVFHTDGGISSHTVLWTPTTPNGTSGTTQELGTLPGGTFSGGSALNDSGQVAGQATSSVGERAFMYDGTIHDLGTLGTGEFSLGFGINDSGQVTGYSDTTADGNAGHAFLWKPTTPGGVSGTMHDLGTLGGTFSTGVAINGSGQVIGNSDTTVGNSDLDHAFVWTPTTPNGTSGDITDLGTLGGTTSQAFGINASGEIIGVADLTGDAANHAFLYTSTSGMLDLTTLIDPLSQWDAASLLPQEINDAGQITGYGTIDGNDHVFLLTPVPEPGSFVLASLGVVGLAVTHLLRHSRIVTSATLTKIRLA
jgi:probable HAF family extracellular repeat protein